MGNFFRVTQLVEFKPEVYRYKTDLVIKPIYIILKIYNDTGQIIKISY